MRREAAVLDGEAGGGEALPAAGGEGGERLDPGGGAEPEDPGAPRGGKLPSPPRARSNGAAAAATGPAAARTSPTLPSSSSPKKWRVRWRPSPRTQRHSRLGIADASSSRSRAAPLSAGSRRGTARKLRTGGRGGGVARGAGLEPDVEEDVEPARPAVLVDRLEDRGGEPARPLPHRVRPRRRHQDAVDAAGGRGLAVEAEDLVAGVVADRLRHPARRRLPERAEEGRVRRAQLGEVEGAEVAALRPRLLVVGELGGEGLERRPRGELRLDVGGSLAGEEVLEPLLVEAGADRVAELVEVSPASESCVSSCASPPADLASAAISEAMSVGVAARCRYSASSAITASMIRLSITRWRTPARNLG